MPQRHGIQQGVFHITTNARDSVPWLTAPGVSEMIIDNLVMTRNVAKAQLYAFCILPDHMHIMLSPGEKGLSRFMQTFKKNSARDARSILHSRSSDSGIAAAGGKTFGWQKGFHDERLQSSAQREACLHYIQGNAMHHHLVHEVLEWPWTSLHFRQLLDPIELWLD